MKTNLEIIIGDVTRKERMKKVFLTHQPNLVYHAAAYKHVPLMELNPSESVRTNLIGTRIVSDLAVEFKIEKFVLISTDKAVNPTNVMGASKRLAEMYCESLNTSHKTKFIITRFGNVLGSNGSVIPLFKKQLNKHVGCIMDDTDFLVKRQKDQFSDAVGKEWIETLKEHAENVVTDQQLESASKVFPHQTPLTKEAYYYRTIFESKFHCDGKNFVAYTNDTVACSSRLAARWCKVDLDPSGNTVKESIKTNCV